VATGDYGVTTMKDLFHQGCDGLRYGGIHDRLGIRWRPRRLSPQLFKSCIILIARYQHHPSIRSGIPEHYYSLRGKT